MIFLPLQRYKAHKVLDHLAADDQTGYRGHKGVGARHSAPCSALALGARGTVIAAEGLVGYVISATASTAKVQTIIDTSSSTSCLISSSRDSIVCKGTLNDVSHLKAMYIPTNATLSQGDTVETSGIGGIYQKGILIGNISRVENSSDLSNRYAVVDLAVNFEKLETVLVITN